MDLLPSPSLTITLTLTLTLTLTKPSPRTGMFHKLSVIAAPQSVKHDQWYLSHAGPAAWNSLPEHIRAEPDIRVFSIWLLEFTCSACNERTTNALDNDDDDDDDDVRTHSDTHSSKRICHRVDCGGHVHPTFVRGCSWDRCKSSEFLRGERETPSVKALLGSKWVRVEPESSLWRVERSSYYSIDRA